MYVWNIFLENNFSCRPVLSSDSWCKQIWLKYVKYKQINENQYMYVDVIVEV